VDLDGSMTFQFGGVSLSAPVPNGTSGTKPGVTGTGSTRELLARFKVPSKSTRILIHVYRYSGLESLSRILKHMFEEA
jgi:hypothetical protein